MARKALYTGSFDIPTRGHLAVYLAAVRCFDRVDILVGNNIRKKYMFDESGRQHLVRLMLTDINVRPDQCTVHLSPRELTAVWARSQGYDVLVRGLRGPADLADEAVAAGVNLKHGNLPTCFFAAPAALQHTSSTVVRELVAFGVPDLEEYLTPGVAHYVRVAMSKTRPA